MRDDVHGYTRGRDSSTARKPFDVIERVPGGKRTDTETFNLERAIRRRDELRHQRRPAFVQDRDGRRVEVARWF